LAIDLDSDMLGSNMDLERNTQALDRAEKAKNKDGIIEQR